MERLDLFDRSLFQTCKKWNLAKAVLPDVDILRLHEEFRRRRSQIKSSQQASRAIASLSLELVEFVTDVCTKTFKANELEL